MVKQTSEIRIIVTDTGVVIMELRVVHVIRVTLFPQKEDVLKSYHARTLVIIQSQEQDRVQEMTGNARPTNIQ